MERGVDRWARRVPLDALQNDVVSQVHRHEHDIERLTTDLAPRLHEVLRWVPPTHAGIAHDHGVPQARRQARLQQPRETLLVVDLQRLHEGVAQQQNPPFPLAPPGATDAEAIVVDEDLCRPLAGVDRRAHIGTMVPAQCVDRLPNVRALHDELLRGNDAHQHLGQAAGERQ